MTYERLKIASFTHSAIFAALLVVWIVPGLQPETFVFGLAHGVMYLASAYNRIIALDADTGKEIWVKDIGQQPSMRGLAYWPGMAGFAPRLVFGTSDNSALMIALDAKTVRESNMSLAMLCAAVLYTPAAMAFWYAAPLVMWQKMAVGKAIFYSFFSVRRAGKARSKRPARFALRPNSGAMI